MPALGEVYWREKRYDETEKVNTPLKLATSCEGFKTLRPKQEQ